MRAIICCGVLLILTVSGGTAQGSAIAGDAGNSSTNLPAAPPVAPQSEVEKADECLKRIPELLNKIAQLEVTTAAIPNQDARVECLRDKVNRLKSLGELTKSAHNQMAAALENQDTNQVDEIVARVLVACARANQLAVEAEACLKIDPVKPKVSNNRIELPPKPADVLPKPAVRATPLKPAKPPAQPTEPHDAVTCLTQEHLAWMIAQVMELSTDQNDTAAGRIAALTKLDIQPVKGWRPGQCATVDDLYVTAAQMMKLEPEQANDPLSCAQALRDQGIAVDALLPARPADGKSPLLLESQARAFFAAGYAAPLPTSRRTRHD